MIERRSVEENAKSFRIQRSTYPVIPVGILELREEYRCSRIESSVFAQEIGNKYMNYALNA